MELRKRLADIDAATFVTDLVAGNPIKNDEEVTLSIGSHATLLLKQVNVASHDTNFPMDWSLVTRLKVMRVHNAT